MSAPSYDGSRAGATRRPQPELMGIGPNLPVAITQIHKPVGIHSLFTACSWYTGWDGLALSQKNPRCVSNGDPKNIKSSSR